MQVYAGVSKIAIHKRAVVIYCYKPYMQATQKYFNNVES